MREEETVWVSRQCPETLESSKGPPAGRKTNQSTNREREGQNTPYDKKQGKGRQAETAVFKIEDCTDLIY